MATPHLVVEHVPLDAIRPHPRNPRRGDVDTIERSIRRHAQYVPLTVQRSTGFILRGNHTWQGLNRVHDDPQPTDAAVIDGAQIVYVDVDDGEATEILLMDNRASDRSAYDNPTLAALLQELDDLEPTGWTGEELDDLLLQLTPPSLDDLANELGEHDPEAVWPYLRIKVSPATKRRLEAWWAGLPGDGDEAKAQALLKWWPSASKRTKVVPV